MDDRRQFALQPPPNPRQMTEERRGRIELERARLARVRAEINRLILRLRFGDWIGQNPPSHVNIRPEHPLEREE